MKTNNWIPEIMYEESADGMTSNIPFIFESRETGEFEPNEDGEPVPIMEMDLHQYADMAMLKEGLSSEEYDTVRKVLGLQPMKQAVLAGKVITENIRKNLENK